MEKDRQNNPNKKKQPRKERGVFERTGKPGWWYRYTYEGRVHLKHADTRSQAVARRMKILSEIKDRTFWPGKYAPAKKTYTVAQWLTHYAEGHTLTQNEKRYRDFWADELGSASLSTLTAAMVRKVQIKALSTPSTLPRKSRAGTVLPGRVWSSATLNRYSAFLRKVLQSAVNSGELGRNPALQQRADREGILFHREAKVSTYLTKDQALQLKAHVSPSDWKPIAFALETGLRASEQFGLKWSQIDFDSGFITLPVTKAGETQQRALSDHAIEILRSLDSFTRSPYIFPSSKNPLRPISFDWFTRTAFIPACHRAGIPTGRPHGISWHSLRHSCASWKALAGADLYSIGKQLGHKHVTTSERYSHLTNEHLRKIANTGSLGETATRTTTSPKHHEPAPSGTGSQVSDSTAEIFGWGTRNRT